MYGERGEDVFYYITIYNENWPQPPKPEGVEEGILRGLYRFRRRERRVSAACSSWHRGRSSSRRCARSSHAGREVRRRRRRLERDQLPAAPQRRARRRALEPAPPRRRAARALRAPSASARRRGRSSPPPTTSRPCRTSSRAGSSGPYTVLGTDGFGRSDTREALRTHFEVNAEHIAYAAMYGLCLDGASTPDELTRAIGELGIDPDRLNPLFA